MPILTKRQNKIPLGLYIHVPFCRSKCEYCDFYSLACKDNKLMEGYLDAVCAHLKEAGSLAPNIRWIPSISAAALPAISVRTVLRPSLPPSAGISMWTMLPRSPWSATPTLSMTGCCTGSGQNRISLGIQTDDDELLKRLGRPHNYAQAVSAYQRIRKAGFKNVSVDLMYGLPGQTLRMWQETLDHVLRLLPEHVSCYGLKVEEGTPLYEYKEAANLPDDETQADMYLAAVEMLRSRGYRHYEISNFARKGLYSRHNMKYWTGGQYLGFGPSASSDFAGKRFILSRDLQSYINGIRGGGEVMEDVQDIPLRERAGEYLMLRLRTHNGIASDEYERKFLLPFAPLQEVLGKYSSLGYTDVNDEGRWHLTAKGYLISNTIISDLLMAQDASQPLSRF